jgi:leucyl aminopeptidase
MLEITFAPVKMPEAGALAFFAAEQQAPSGLWRAADEVSAGQIGRALGAAGFNAGASELCAILAPASFLSRVVAVGLGAADKRTDATLVQAGGRALASLLRDETAAIDASGLGAAQVAHVALGAVLRAYRFDRYRTREKPEDKPRLTHLTLLTEVADEAAAEWTRLRAVAAGVCLTRDLVTEPPNVLTPAEFARRIEDLTRLGLEVEVLGPDALRALNFGALLGVAQGSVNEPRVAIMRWQGGADAAAPPVAFIGKGVTFDSGGISIKPAAGMEDMKWDMAGAGTVTGLMAALAGRKARVNAVGLVGLVENMPGSAAQRPSDVVTTASGQTVEIINTDAEGRMVLADVLWYCQDRFKPRFMVDLATLTGAMVVSLGHEMAGMFSNDDTLAMHLTAAGRATEEALWRMPLGDAYDRQLKSDIADMKHVTGRPGSAITAACFLQRFVNGVPWAHLDIAGTAWTGKDHAVTPKGATAFGVRLLDRLVADHYEA